MSLFDELKRRNVVRVGIAYVLLAWVLLQAADFGLDLIDAPNWVIQALVMLAVIGLPGVLVFSWIFEMTPEGLKREADIDRSQSITPQTGRKLDRAIIATLAVAVALLVFDRFQSDDAKPAPPTNNSATASEKSIAVLPFVNMSSDPEQEYFSDGISEEILNALAGVRELKVAGRTSSFAFKGRNEDLREIGNALGVNHILEGSVRKAGDRVRITAQLVQVEDGFHLWSETYDRELIDVFAIQDEISGAILEQMKLALLDAPARTRGPADTLAYDLYLLAKQNLRERTEASIQTAVAQLDRAIAKDPDFAPALAQRAIAELLLSVDEYGTIPNEQTRRNAKPWIDRALELDDNLAEAWAALGLFWGQAARRGERQNGVESLQRALEINPNLTNAANWLQGIMVDQGRLQDSIELLEQLIERDPLYRPGVANLVLRYCVAGRINDARSLLESARASFIDAPFLKDLESAVLNFDGRTGDALPLAREAWSEYPNDNGARFRYALMLWRLQEPEAILELNGDEFRVAALAQLGRTEEATLLAYKLAATGESTDGMFYFLGSGGRHAELVEYFETRWASIADWKADFPSLAGFGDLPLAFLAHAYRTVGNGERFEEAVRFLEESLAKQRSEAADNLVLLQSEAYLFMLKNDEERALRALAESVERGQLYTPRLTDDLPVFRPLEGDPRFEAIQARNIDMINRERAKLGWAPIVLDRTS